MACDEECWLEEYDRVGVFVICWSIGFCTCSVISLLNCLLFNRMKTGIILGKVLILH